MNINQLVELLHQGRVIAYPTEAVFGLGCDPNNQSAVEKLLVLKQRAPQKGLILVAPDIRFLRPFIDERPLQEIHWQRLQQEYAHPTTWVMPAKTSTPKLLTGSFDTIAVRLCTHPAVRLLCESSGTALTSTSANLSGRPPCKSAAEVYRQFGPNFPVLDMPLGTADKPSEIRDIFSCKVFRQG
ncbi:L-threonylcarbamoyladenylate synthase [Mesocricetibacter intestinalis]|uniref:Threonylcarbamoyl-AMP synthase n=1 Tax=Mesocricetibacter intestinalis TaxID=1521930 RepID=A0A4R6V6V4_9PAST|nr:Sua5/YciO/YrdC/YwlC family protein [Mesocricetibacter intestinalis]TDQ56640.1 L-threonylcarbamoyladenylate synthase [Mesocricetibacter intestinalis]